MLVTVDDSGGEVPVTETGGIGEIAIRGHNVMKGYRGPAGGDRGRDARRLVPHR